LRSCARSRTVEKSRLFGLANQFLIGASYDHGNVDYAASSELGFFQPRYVVASFDDPIYMTGPTGVHPRAIATTNDYVGIYVANTTDVTRDLAVTVGARWNYAKLELDNNNPLPAPIGDQISGTHEFYHFNPMAGATYQLMPGLSLYGGFSVANRAPTPAELSCADPDYPCLIESFLTADPPLKQVVSYTWELGLRGKLASLGDQQRLEWSAGLFRTENTDDILSVSSAAQNGRGYFLNAGDTLRQGVEAGVTYRDRRWSAYANYAFVDATFLNANIFSSQDNPAAFQCLDPSSPAEPDTANCIAVQAGDRLPGIPRHRFKVGADYWVTPQWSVGADLVAASDQVFFGDESNQNAPLPGYAKVDVRTGYNITEHVQIYGMVNNIFDARYGLYGIFFNKEAGARAGEVDGTSDTIDGGTARSITPAAPVAAYGGLRVRY
jgi:iron complex outermembrane recepter protein